MKARNTKKRIRKSETSMKMRKYKGNTEKIRDKCYLSQAKLTAAWFDKCLMMRCNFNFFKKQGRNVSKLWKYSFK